MSRAALQPSQTMLRWIRPPQQARTRESLTRLLDAAEALIARKGFEDAGILEMARRAGCSVGGFYRRFRDKDGLLHALHERFCAEARATADVALDPGRWQGASTADILGEFTSFLVHIYRERQGLLRAFLRQGAADARLRQRTDQLFAHIVERLQRLLRERRAEVTHPDPQLAAGFGVHVVLGTLNHLSLNQPESPRLDDARLSRELSRVFRAYLGAAPRPLPTHSTKRRNTPR